MSEGRQGGEFRLDQAMRASLRPGTDPEVLESYLECLPEPVRALALRHFVKYDTLDELKRAFPEIQGVPHDGSQRQALIVPELGDLRVSNPSIQSCLDSLARYHRACRHQ